MSDNHDVQFAEQVERLLEDKDHGLDVGISGFFWQLADSAPRPREAFIDQLYVQLQTQIQEETNRMPVQTRRLSVKIAAILAATLILATVVYAVDAILQQVIDMDPGLKEASDADLGVPLDLTQTVDGLTVHMQWVYADANRLSIGYTVSGDGPLDSPAVDYYPWDTRLTDAEGNVFESAGGMGYTGEGGAAASIASFNMSHLTEPPEMLELHLEMNVEIMTRETRATLEAQLPPTPDPEATEPPEHMTVMLDPITPQNSPFDGPYGPFVFEFSVPVGESRVVEISETVTDEEIDVTLERVVITSSQTRVQVCFDPPSERSGGWTPAPHLRIDGSDVLKDNMISVGTAPIEDTNCHWIIYNAGFYDRTGDWQFEVSELIGFGDTGGDQIRIAGSWLFDFAVSDS